jgi:AraC family transcriptional regulator of adaptative response / DNA-3-methyladenine glycosylase II
LYCSSGTGAGWLTVKPLAKENTALLTVYGTPPAMLFDIVRRTRALLDAEADPVSIRDVLARDRLLKPCVMKRPGLRVPGAWNPFELAVRAVLGQQVSVAAARTLAARLVKRFGHELPQAFASELTHRFPSPEEVLDSDFESIGVTAKRAAALRELAAACVDGRVDFRLAPDALCANLQRLPGIGPWTAQYIAMRVLRDPDALPAGDLVLRQMLGNGKAISEREAERRAEAWRPWRAYGLMHLWAKASEQQEQ